MGVCAVPEMVNEIPRRLWVALDSHTGKYSLEDRAALAVTLLERLRDAVPNTQHVYVKLESAFRWGGYNWIASLMDTYGEQVKFFCDGKLTGTMSTLVEDACECERLGVTAVTVTCLNRLDVLRAFKECAPSVCVLGVSELTSNAPNLPRVMADANSAMPSGLDGMIAPGYAVARLRQVHTRAHLVTPNIREPLTVVRGDDQHPNVSVTLKKAFALGANDVVVGRPITDADDPVKVYLSMLEEMGG